MRQPKFDGVDAVSALIYSVLDQRQATQLADDKQVLDAGLILRRQIRHVCRHAGTGHHHGDRADRTSVGAEAVANALVSVDDDGLAADHRQHIAFGANAGASSAADAVVRVDVRMLGLGTFGKQLAFFNRFTRTGLLLLLAPEIAEEKEEANEATNPVCNERIHGPRLEVPQKELQSDVQQREHGERRS